MVNRRKLKAVIGTIVVLFIVYISIPEDSAYSVKPTSALAQISTLSTALEAFDDDVRRYPATSEGFQVLLKCPSSVTQDLWHGPYLKNECPKDPWGQEYRYTYTPVKSPLRGVNFEVISAGRDGKFGTEDDLNNGQKKIPPIYKGGFFDQLQRKIEYLKHPGWVY